MALKSKKIIFTVTNELLYDQRMMRICTSLSNAGYTVTLVGWQLSENTPLNETTFYQKRLRLYIKNGKFKYINYWIVLFFYLLKNKASVICAIDLDTIIPVFFASKLLATKRVYDAHEIFSEMQEVNSRPFIKKIWNWIAKTFIPKFPIGYTIGDEYARFFKENYSVNYAVVRNATVLKAFTIPDKIEKYILYQGAVNVGRCFEQLIPAMQYVDAPLYIVGEGNYYKDVASLIQQYRLENKIHLLGYKRPEELKTYTEKAWIGITLFDATNDGKSNHYSMANRFFDYMHNGVPQLCNNYPEYQKVNKNYPLALLIDELSPENIAQALNELLTNDVLHLSLTKGALAARQVYNWQVEEQQLIKIYDKLLAH